jgi:hypothetical protein
MDFKCDTCDKTFSEFEEIDDGRKDAEWKSQGKDAKEA